MNRPEKLAKTVRGEDGEWVVAMVIDGGKERTVSFMTEAEARACVRGFLIDLTD